MRIEVRVPVSLQGLIRKMEGAGLEKAVREAVKRTVRGSRKDASSKVKERYTVSAGAVAPTLKVKMKGLSGSLSSRGQRNPLDRFKHNPKVRVTPAAAGGIYASVVKGQGGNIFRAFLQRSGGIWERTGKSRYPIRKFKSVSAPQMIGSPPVSQFIIQKMEQRFLKAFEHGALAVIGGYL